MRVGQDQSGIVNGDSQVWFGVALPLGAPRAIVMKLNGAVNKVLQSPEAIKRMQDLGLEVVGGTPEAAETFVKREAAAVRQLIKACLHPVFAQCRDSYRERSADGRCTVCA